MARRCLLVRSHHLKSANSGSGWLHRRLGVMRTDKAGMKLQRRRESLRGGAYSFNARSKRGLFCCWCEAPEIHVRCRGKIGEGRPHCDRLVELLRIDLVERVVCGVMGVEIIESVLAQ